MLAQFPNLIKLDLRIVSRESLDFSPLSALHDLKELSIEWSIKDSWLEHFPVGLTKLFICSGDITDAGLKHLGRFPDLTELKIERQGLEDPGLANIARRCPNLTKLGLCGNHFRKISDLGTLGCLTDLDLSRCNLIGDFSGIEDLLELTTLNLSNTSISQDSFKYFPTGITTLDLSESYNCVTDVRGLRRLPSLNHLNLSGLRDLRDVSPLKELTSLRTLNLEGLKIPDENLVFLADLPKLQTLVLPSKRKLEGPAIKEYFSSLSK